MHANLLPPRMKMCLPFQDRFFCTQPADIQAIRILCETACCFFDKFKEDVKLLTSRSKLLKTDFNISSRAGRCSSSKKSSVSVLKNINIITLRLSIQNKERYQFRVTSTISNSRYIHLQKERK
jgi:hypothetical protein